MKSTQDLIGQDYLDITIEPQNIKPGTISVIVHGASAANYSIRASENKSYLFLQYGFAEFGTISYL